MARLPVALYVPNLLGYARIQLAFLGLIYAHEHASTAILIWISSGTLDLFDGILARRLNQTSTFGILLDIAADNILRTVTWVACIQVAADQTRIVVLCSFVICLEWLTMLATQLHSKTGEQHWKKTRQGDPYLIKYFFSNNFRNPLGTWGIMGLFGCPLCLFASHHEQMYDVVAKWPLVWLALRLMVYSGRFISGIIECYFVITYLKMVTMLV